ncbi:MAG: cell division topological specificity factor MinE [Chloroflexi bacterium HGW-Chloroflexi-10]|nr:MAG: cell division topological specificity factor MinE [Chloroflexi bacterium HGW-Chloroflexi-10]
MDGFLDRLMGKKQKSASTAKERLKLVLIHDRADITPGQMDMMKNDLLHVISKYIDIDPDLVQINMTQDGREQRLVADIPISSTVRKRTR